MLYHFSVNNAWLHTLRRVFVGGSVVDVGSGNVAGARTKELLNISTTFWMAFPLLTVAERRLNYRFAFAEPWWILSGYDDPSLLAPYNPKLAEFLGGTTKTFGAYGPRIAEQLEYIIDTLSADPNSRRAVLSIWRPNPPTGERDIPCTALIQFFIRNGELHVIDTMRSSDLWLGWPYDAMCFSMLAGVVCLRLRERGLLCSLGQLSINAGSQHFYYSHLEGISRMMVPPLEIKHHLYGAFNPFDFSDPAALVDHLKNLADGTATAGWLHDFNWKACPK